MGFLVCHVELSILGRDAFLFSHLLIVFTVMAISGGDELQKAE